MPAKNTRPTSSSQVTRWDAIDRIRFSQARKLLGDRYGHTVPNDDAGWDDLRIALHLRARCVDPERRVKALLEQIGLLAPWMRKDKAEQLAVKTAAKPLGKLKAITIGRRLNLDAATRERLKLWQLAAIDDTPETKKARRRRRDAERRRRKRGRKPREQYLAEALTSTRPWELDGVSRAKWYRRLKAGRETGVSADIFSLSADTPVSGEAKEGAAVASVPVEPPAHHPRPRARRSTGKGDYRRATSPQAKPRTCANGHQGSTTMNERANGSAGKATHPSRTGQATDLRHEPDGTAEERELREIMVADAEVARRRTVLQEARE